jgi:hypothetical protein
MSLENTTAANSVSKRLQKCFKDGIHSAVKTILWLMSLMIPISFVVLLLDYSGLLFIMAQYTMPIVKYFGLRGEAALVLLTSGLLNIYSVIAVIQTIDFTIREITILSLMCLIAHNLIIETAVQKKTGSNAIQIVVLRIVFAFIGGGLLNLLLPGAAVSISTQLIAPEHLPFMDMLINWGKDTLYLIVKMVTIVSLLHILQKIMDEFSITQYLSNFMAPVLRFFGLPVQAAFMWLIANVIGLAWGSSVLIEQTQQGKISRKEADLLNQHIAISHSLLEDTLLFVAIGVPVLWMIFPRLILAFFVVWGYRFFLNRYKPVLK